MFKKPGVYVNIVLSLVVLMLVVNTFNLPGHTFIKRAIAAVANITGEGTVTSLSRFVGASGLSNTIGSSIIYDDGENHVGIGTTAPANLFTLSQAGNTTAATRGSYGFSLNLTTAEQITMGADATFAYLQTWSAKPLYINSQGNNVLFGSGNVGIGTTSPGSKLEVAGGNIELDPGYFIVTNLSGTRELLGSDATGHGQTIVRSIDSDTGDGIQFQSAADGALMEILNTGNVGIGTTTPSQKLDVEILTTDAVNGSVANSYPIADFINHGSGGGLRGLQIGAPTGDVVSPVYLKVAGTSSRFSIIDQADTENFTVLDSGNVGIGTTAPGAKLDVGAAVAPSSNAIFRDRNNAVGVEVDQYGTLIANASILNSNGVFSTASDGTPFTFLEGASEKMRISSTGNVGIGTTAPVRKTDIVSTSEQLRLAYDTSGTVYTDFRNDSAGGLLVNTSGGYIINYIGGSEKMRILASGNVGIGTTTPAYKLQVAGSLDAESITINGTPVGSGGSQWTTSGSNIYYTTGNVGIGTNNPVYGSLSIMDTDDSVLDSAMWGSSTGAGAVSAVYNLSQTVGSVAGIRLITRNSGAKVWNIYNVSTGAATGDLAFGGGSGTGSEVMRMTNGGNIGIGTTTPVAGSKLDVSGLIAATGANAGVSMQSRDGTGDSFQWYNPTGDNLHLYTDSTGGTGVLTISKLGNIGIGTTSPATKLEIANPGWLRLADGRQIEWGGTNTMIYGYNSGEIYFNNSGGTRMFIQANGNVGIGTSTPSVNLHVAGTSGNWPAYFKSQAEHYVFGVYTDGGGAGIGTSASLGIYMATNGTHIYSMDGYPRMSVTPSATVITNSLGVGGAPGMDAYATGYLQVRVPYAEDSGDVQRHGLIISTSEGSTGAISVIAGVNPTQKFGYIGASQVGTSADPFILNPWGGNVGIGISSPGASFHVHEAGGLGEVRLSGTATGADTFQLMQGVTGVTNAGFSIYDVEDTTSRLVIDTSGNVGIGTTTPTAPLQLGRVFSMWQDVNSGYIGANFGGGTSGNYIISQYANQIHFDSATGLINFKVAGSGTAGSAISYTTAMTIKSDGNVGIGTTTPQTKFVVSNSGTTQGIEINPDFIQSFNRSGGAYAALPFYGSSFSFNVGSVGIGTTSPSHQLHMVSATNYDSLFINGPAAPGIGFGQYTATTSAWHLGLSGNDGAAFAISSGTGATDRLFINSSGNVGIGTTSPAQKLDVAGYIKSSSGFQSSDTFRTWRAAGIGMTAGATIDLLVTNEWYYSTQGILTVSCDHGSRSHGMYGLTMSAYGGIVSTITQTASVSFTIVTGSPAAGKATLQMTNTSAQGSTCYVTLMETTPTANSVTSSYLQ